VTRDERQAALDQIADEVRGCVACRLSETRTRSVPGEGDPDTEVVFVGEGPGFNEDREGRPFVGRAGGLLVRLLGHIGWTREDVFITNVVKCRPPDNRDPEPAEISACAAFLRRQLEVLDPAVVVTLGRHSMATFRPGARIGQIHGTTILADPATGARDASVLAMYHPAAALRSPSVERESFDDIALLPGVLSGSRDRRAGSIPTASLTPSTPTSSAASTASSLTASVSTSSPSSSPSPATPSSPSAMQSITRLDGAAMQSMTRTFAPGVSATSSAAAPAHAASADDESQLTLF
jgi:DNA polymerase